MAGAVAAVDSAAAALQGGGSVNFNRMLRHFWMTRWYARSLFNTSVMSAIEDAIRTAEFTHGGEIRFAVEPELETPALLNDVSPRDRAVQIFGQLGIWDTAQNNGVLIYVLLADHDVEIVADRGYANRVSTDEWTAVCQRIETAFKAGEFERGAVEGIAAVSKLIARHFPAIDRNELPDKPVLL